MFEIADSSPGWPHMARGAGIVERVTGQTGPRVEHSELGVSAAGEQGQRFVTPG